MQIATLDRATPFTCAFGSAIIFLTLPKTRRMKKLVGFLLVTFIVAMTLGGCMRNDDEPVMPVRPIARLYISVGNYQTNASEDPIDNVLLIDPADTAETEM